MSCFNTCDQIRKIKSIGSAKSMKFIILAIISFCLLATIGCSGFSRLPQIDFIGKSREDAIKIFAKNPEKAWGTHINICTPLKETPPYYCGNNRYFITLEDALADEQLKKAPALGGYMTQRWLAIPGAWDYYVITFDENNIVVAQKIHSLQDG